MIQMPPNKELPMTIAMDTLSEKSLRSGNFWIVLRASLELWSFPFSTVGSVSVFAFGVCLIGILVFFRQGQMSLLKQ